MDRDEARQDKMKTRNAETDLEAVYGTTDNGVFSIETPTP